MPTWNYVTAHVTGEFVVHDDAAWVEQLVRDLTAWHERDFEPPWQVDDAPPRYLAGQLRAIVGIEVRITAIEAKFKLSQNRSQADISGVAAGVDGTALARGDARRRRHVARGQIGVERVEALQAPARGAPAAPPRPPRAPRRARAPA